VDRHRKTGEIIAPNANRIMKDLIGHASELGLSELAEVIRDAFDPDVRNAVAHADYIIRTDGLLLRWRNGGTPRMIPWDEFHALIRRELGLFDFIRQITSEYVHSYETPKIIRARLADEPEQDWTIYCDAKTRAFGSPRDHIHRREATNPLPGLSRLTGVHEKMSHTGRAQWLDRARNPQKR
jgi:hypothetical protein